MTERFPGRWTNGSDRDPRLGASREAVSWPASWSPWHRTSGNRRPRRRLAVVLSGGATRGAFQIGVIDVLTRRGIVPDILVGTSVGAINAAYWAFHPGEDVGPRLLEVWREAARARILPDRPLRILGNLIGSRLHERSGLGRILERELPNVAATIESAQVPLHIVACDLRTGAAVDFDRGPALPALLASAAVPGVFPPVFIEGEPYVDGGVVANCPIEVAWQAGATDVIAVDLAGESVRVPALGGFRALERALNVSIANQTRRELEALQPELRVALLRPRYDLAPGFGDFSQTAALYLHGRFAGERFLAEHWLGAGKVRPGVMDVEVEGAGPAAPVASSGLRAPRLRSAFDRMHHRRREVPPGEAAAAPII